MGKRRGEEPITYRLLLLPHRGIKIIKPDLEMKGVKR